LHHFENPTAIPLALSFKLTLTPVNVSCVWWDVAESFLISVYRYILFNNASIQ
jgi:hypothetical protein